MLNCAAEGIHQRGGLGCDPALVSVPRHIRMGRSTLAMSWPSPADRVPRACSRYRALLTAIWLTAWE